MEYLKVERPIPMAWVVWPTSWDYYDIRAVGVVTPMWMGRGHPQQTTTSVCSYKEIGEDNYTDEE